VTFIVTSTTAGSLASAAAGAAGPAAVLPVATLRGFRSGKATNS
jgi:hypothetical protein